MRWPTLKTAPRADGPPVAWARWYRDVLGWLVLPTRCDEDVEGFRAYLLRKAIREAEAKGRVSDDLRAKLQRETDVEAEKSRKGPMVKWTGRDSVSNIEIDAWWGNGAGERGAKRGIWVAMGRVDSRAVGAGATGLAVHCVDLDPRSGCVLSEWVGYGGPISETTGGGQHFMVLPVDGLGHTESEVADGIDTKVLGGGVVVPSGASSPGRRWVQWSAPCEAPERVLDRSKWNGRNLHRKNEKRTKVIATDGEASDGPAAASTFAECLAATAPDGTRNATAASLVGILARPCSIPEDAVEAALAMLADAGESDMARWRSDLTRGPRDEETAVAFLRAWNSTRCDPPWTDGHIERVTRSLWKTADRREGGNAGAEDLGVGEVWTPEAGPSLADIRARLRLGEGASEEKVTVDGSELAAPGTEEATGPRVRVPAPLVIPDGFCIPLWDGYSLDDIHADMDVEPISIAYLPRWLGWDEKEDAGAAYGYGLGPWFDESVAGGLNRGSFWSLGALTAKAGKTMFLGQLVEGLTLLSAMRLAGRTGEPDADTLPIILPFWITEMQKHRDVAHRMIGRYLGIDISMIGRGRRGYNAPGIRQMALRYSQPPEVVMLAARRRIDRHLGDPASLLAMMGGSGPGGLTVNIDPQSLPPKRGGRHAENPRLGAALLERTEAAVVARVAAFAAAWEIDPDRIIPLLILDPPHRFIDAAGEDRLTALNLVIHKAREMAHERRWIVVCTSDTTKSGASEEKDKMLNGDPAQLASSAFAGSQNLAHEPDTIIVLHAEEKTPDEGHYIVERPVWVRVCLCRRSSPGPALPFTWEPHTGRYTARDPSAKDSGVPKEVGPRTPAKKRSGRPPKGVR